MLSIFSGYPGLGFNGIEIFGKFMRSKDHTMGVGFFIGLIENDTLQF